MMTTLSERLSTNGSPIRSRRQTMPRKLTDEEMDLVNQAFHIFDAGDVVRTALYRMNVRCQIRWDMSIVMN